ICSSVVNNSDSVDLPRRLAATTGSSLWKPSEDALEDFLLPGPLGSGCGPASSFEEDTMTDPPVYTVAVDAPPEKVWPLVADLDRHGGWSPQPYRVEWEAGAPHAGRTR